MTTRTAVSEASNDRWLAADRMAMREEAKVTDVERTISGTMSRLRLDEVPDFLPGQYYLVRPAVDAPPGAAEQAYSLCSSPYPPSTEVEIAVREIPGGRASPLLARQVKVGDLLQIRSVESMHAVVQAHLHYTRGSHDPYARYRRRIDADIVITTRSILGFLGVADESIYSEDHA